MFKRYLLCFIVFLTALASIQAQKKIKESAVPAEVLKTFKKKYPHAINPVWRQHGTNEFDVDYEIGPRVFISKFAADGKWLETETDVALTNLPRPVKEEWKKNDHKDWEILYIVKIEEPADSTMVKTYYQIAVKKSKEMKGVLIAADGKSSQTVDIK